MLVSHSAPTDMASRAAATCSLWARQLHSSGVLSMPRAVKGVMGVVATSPEAYRRPAAPAVHRGRVLPIVTYPSPSLRDECAAVPKDDYLSSALQANADGPPPPPSLAPWLDELVKNLRATATFQDALGLSAPQVGAKARVFVMRRPRSLMPPSATTTSFEVCINPVVRSAKDREIIFPEGCFSVPAFESYVRRKHTITAEWVNEHGEARRAVLQGLPAAVFQHELDHLDGVLLLDRELLDVRGTAVADEADRRADEEFRRHFIAERPASKARSTRKESVRVDEI
jgi:peptide deformylase